MWLDIVCEDADTMSDPESDLDQEPVGGAAPAASSSLTPRFASTSMGNRSVATSISALDSVSIPGTFFASVPCAVCKLFPSDGTHYGAKTCTACSSFFRSCTLMNYKFEQCAACKQNEACPRPVRDCTCCRIRACRSAGMKPSVKMVQKAMVAPARKCDVNVDALVAQLDHVTPCFDYFSFGACNLGDRCSHEHQRPVTSRTLLMKKLYHSPKIDTKMAYFDEFFEEIFSELSSKYGEMEDMIVCGNSGEHMFGNVYIKFMDESSADKAVADLNTNRWFNGEPIYAELSPVTDFREACCRQYELGCCNKGDLCAAWHCKEITAELRSKLYGSKALPERYGGDRGRDRERRGDRGEWGSGGGRGGDDRRRSDYGGGGRGGGDRGWGGYGSGGGGGGRRRSRSPRR